ncbi:uncharacterized protein LY89DRAFT_694098 [Mollisia scopiformis]|uniref:Velvet domain-containing protein n=1 Tax=Mollisia scopiformis TaxID=149040 RepID=A0A194XRR7_MOLSC|nr:uncharacterized protein LY89DRAFT_694098 [Mollisia scopiformis]KUJ22888.1 hypothetical protein LY89DRAFT_694098 [Mollisia scopiformis]
MGRTPSKNPNDGPRPVAPGSAPQYPLSHNAPMGQHSTYDPYHAMVSRAPPPEAMQVQDGLAPLASGTQPAVQPPLVKSLTHDGRRYELVVVQQPRRARMCGFGDKDRRPITPPPCVRLIITDILTGKEVDCNEIEHGMFVLNVDLWDEFGHREVNLVRHSGSSPGISSTTPASYQDGPGVYSNIAPQQQPFKLEPGQQGAYNPYPNQPQVNPYSNGQPAPYNNGSQYQSYSQSTNGSGYTPQSYSQAPQGVYYTTTPGGIHGAPPPQGAEYGQHQLSYGNRQYTPADMAVQRAPVNSGQPQGMFTRNLIGSLAASAFRLTDPEDKIGIWFVLQDLSVRTEGAFRLRFSFVNVGVQGSASTGPGKNVSSTTVNTGRAPVLASCFSESFTVYSAKRFPGVVESTGLSKCFATQGIKIPIRKDGPGKGDKDKDFEDD